MKVDIGTNYEERPIAALVRAMRSFNETDGYRESATWWKALWDLRELVSRFGVDGILLDGDASKSESSHTVGVPPSDDEGPFGIWVAAAGNWLIFDNGEIFSTPYRAVAEAQLQRKSPSIGLCTIRSFNQSHKGRGS